MLLLGRIKTQDLPRKLAERTVHTVRYTKSYVQVKLFSLFVGDDIS